MKRKKYKKESFMQSVVILMLSQVFIKILGLVYKLYLTNREGFGDKGNAIYGSGFQIYALFLTISSVGIPGAISKLISERVAIGDYKSAHRIFKIAFITFGFIGFMCSSILFLGASTIANNFLQIPEAELTLVALSPSIFFVSISCVIKGYFNGRQNLKVTAHSQSLEQLFKAVLSVILVEGIAMSTGMNTGIMAAGANLATTLATILCFFYLYHYYHIRKKIIAWEIKNSINYTPTRVRKTLKQILGTSIPMSMSAILGTVNKNIDSMTVVRGLKNFLTEEQAKIQYGILNGKVDTLVTLPMSLNMALSTALLPSISTAKAKGDIATIKKRISFTLLVTILIALPCMVSMFIFAKPILELLFPNAASGSFIYQISCLGIIFIVLEQTMGGALHGLGKAGIPAISLAIGVIAKLLLNLYLVPINPNIFFLGGTAGAAFSTVVCHIIATTIEFKMLKKYINLNLKKAQFIFKPFFSILAMAVASCSAYQFFFMRVGSKISTIIALLIGLIIYIIMVILLRIFSKEQIYMIPYGKKLYQFLENLGLYRDRRS